MSLTILEEGAQVGHAKETLFLDLVKKANPNSKLARLDLANEKDVLLLSEKID